VFVQEFLEHVDVVDAHYFPTVNVDHLLIEQVSCEQQESFRPIVGGPLGRGGGSTDAPVDRGYCCKWENSIASLGPHNEHRDAGAILLKNQSNLAHSPAGIARGVENGGTQQLGKGESDHIRENTQLQWWNPARTSECREGHSSSLKTAFGAIPLLGRVDN
jgi:hypothetical protein